MTISDRAKERVKTVLRAGEKAVDATLGNGWDTTFLAQIVGPQGRVWGFDVQEAAVAATEKRLRRDGVSEWCELHHCGHEQMADFVTGPLAAVMFNLGYFPYADREIITCGETTVRALRVACALLRPGGVVTIACYLGHPGGGEEAVQVLAFLAELDVPFRVEAPREVPDDGVAFLAIVSRSY